MAKLYKDERFAVRIDQIAWISLQKGNRTNLDPDEMRPRVNIILVGNNAKNSIFCNSEEEAKKLYDTLVEEINNL